MKGIHAILLKKLIRTLAIVTFVFSLVQNSFALTQNEKLWLAVYHQFKLRQDEKWQGLLYSQVRLINQSHPLELALLEAGLGYSFIPNNTLWFGYRWTGHQPFHDLIQENRLFEQYSWSTARGQWKVLSSRSRLEQIIRSDRGQASIRFRQRFAIEIQQEVMTNMLPYFFDELFIQLNRTDWTSNKLITQNRLFLGVNWYLDSKSWWEIGYINQYILKTPAMTQNDMSHVLSITYNFLV